QRKWGFYNFRKEFYPLFLSFLLASSINLEARLIISATFSLLMFFHIAAAATASGSSAPDAFAFATTSLKPLPFFPISSPALVFFTTSDFFLALNPADGASSFVGLGILYPLSFA